jgi:hypothetical protein
MATGRGARRSPSLEREGDRLYFDRNNELWEIEVRVGDTPAFSRARRLFAGQVSRSWPSYYGYDVSADGRFLRVANRMQSVAPVMTLIENWHLQLADRK